MQEDKWTKEDLDQEAERTAYLIAGFIRQTLTAEEHDELDRLGGGFGCQYAASEELVNPAYSKWMYRVAQEGLRAKREEA